MDNVFNTGTRIFKAFDVDDKEKKSPLIIKDHWHIDFHDSEDRIQEAILENINDPDEREIFKRSTFTVIASERVQIDGRDDHTKGTILGGVSPKRAYQVVLRSDFLLRKGEFIVIKKDKFWSEASGDPSPGSLKKVARNEMDIYYHRYHHRVVYKEVAIPYSRLSNLKDMVIVLEHSIEGKRIHFLSV